MLHCNHHLVQEFFEMQKIKMNLGILSILIFLLELDCDMNWFGKQIIRHKRHVSTLFHYELHKVFTVTPTWTFSIPNAVSYERLLFQLFQYSTQRDLSTQTSDSYVCQCTVWTMACHIQTSKCRSRRKMRLNVDDTQKFLLQ